jgi:hypothetical protein
MLSKFLFCPVLFTFLLDQYAFHEAVLFFLKRQSSCKDVEQDLFLFLGSDEHRAARFLNCPWVVVLSITSKIVWHPRTVCSLF